LRELCEMGGGSVMRCIASACPLTDNALDRDPRRGLGRA
jgi:hypothetical protein